MKRPFGICHICGKECKLTYEHIPPAGAYNRDATKMILGKEFFNNLKECKSTSVLRYTNMQRGVGDNTLCEACNNRTGAWYADDYIKISNAIYDFFGHHVEELKNASQIELTVKEIYPLRFIKQIIAMFMSIIPNEFLHNYKDLREYLLNKNSNDFQINKYRLSMGLLKNDFKSWSGLNHLIMKNEKKKTVSYLAVAPFYFVLEFEPDEIIYDYLIDITKFGYEYNYDDKIQLQLRSNLLDSKMVYPVNLSKDFST